jgi:aspartate carbamoyltransferase regulatory subunit
LTISSFAIGRTASHRQFSETMPKTGPCSSLPINLVNAMSATGEDKLRIVKINNGTVIDHIRAGVALEVLQILDITGKEGTVVTLAMNISSHRIGRKDIVKLEERILADAEVARIALVAPEATINLIKNGLVVKKTRVKLPDVLTDIVTCPNTRCITNQEREPVRPKYQVVSSSPITLKCLYCWTLVDESEIVAQFTKKR